MTPLPPGTQDLQPLSVALLALERRCSPDSKNLQFARQCKRGLLLQGEETGPLKLTGRSGGTHFPASGWPGARALRRMSIYRHWDRAGSKAERGPGSASGGRKESRASGAGAAEAGGRLLPPQAHSHAQRASGSSGPACASTRSRGRSLPRSARSPVPTRGRKPAARARRPIAGARPAHRRPRGGYKLPAAPGRLREGPTRLLPGCPRLARSFRP